MIDKFRGDYFFLSNFYHCKIPYEGLTYPSVEHAFQANKTFNEDIRRIIKSAPTASHAKIKGRNIPLTYFRKDWESVKVEVMYNLLKIKFSDPALALMLEHTSPHELVEGNYWGDTFWGVCRGTGQNHLGKLLMKIRDKTSLML
jgi:N-glycosidase YbiA